MISFRKCGLDPTGSTAFEGIVTDIIRPSCDRILKINLAAFTTHTCWPAPLCEIALVLVSGTDMIQDVTELSRDSWAADR